MIDLSRLHDKLYRLENLYYIVDRNGNNILFKMNDVQRDVFQNLHNRNIILKARQLGMSTFAVLYILDEVIFNFNLSAGIVSYSLQHAKHVFKRIIGNAIDNLPKEIFPIGIVSRSAHEISFNNGSHLQVNTTLRGGTCQLALISEFGKTCARYPQKAEEIISGTLNTLPQDATIIIESTGEGSEGYFAEMVFSAEARGNDDLSPLEYKLFFYPWYQEKSYRMTHKVRYDVDVSDYFDELEKQQNIKLEEQQKYWYVHQRDILKEKIGQEFPSTVKEAFLSSSDAYYYAECIQKAYSENRCLYTDIYDQIEKVYCAMDIGVNDKTVIIFFQVVHGEIRIIDFYADSNKGVDFYVSFLLKDKPYLYDTIFLPHDSTKRDGIVVQNSYEKEFRYLFKNMNTKIVVLKRTDVQIGIAQAKSKFSRCVFNIAKVKGLLDYIGKYRKQWQESTGRYIEKPLHDDSSNYADAFRYVSQAVDQIEKGISTRSAIQKHKEVVESRKRIL